MKRLLSFLAAISLLFATAGLSLTPASAQDHGDHTGGPAGAFSDQEFLRMMIMHHHMAVLMAEPVQTRALHPEVAELAAQIVRDQTSEIALMQGWLRDWYGLEMPALDHGLAMPGMGAGGMMPAGHAPGAASPGMAPAQMPMRGGMSMSDMMTRMDPAMMDMMMHMMAEEMQTLPDDRLEAAFMMMMVEHHRAAIEMAEMASTQARQPEVRQLARDIIAAQSSEIRQLNHWLSLWFNL